MCLPKIRFPFLVTLLFSTEPDAAVALMVDIALLAAGRDRSTLGSNSFMIKHMHHHSADRISLEFAANALNSIQ